MFRRLRVLGAALVAAGFLSACSGGGGGTTTSPFPAAAQQPSQPGTATATRTYTLGSAAASYALPPLGGFGGSVAMPAAAVPAGTNLELTSALQAPAGGPKLEDLKRASQTAGTLNVYFYTTIRLSATITFQSLPGFTLTLPNTINPAGQQFFYAVQTRPPSSGAVLSFATQGPAQVAGQTVTFAPSNTPLTLLAGKSYIVAFYAVSATKVVGASKIYVANLLGDSVTTYNADGTSSAPTITAGVNRPTSVAVDSTGKIYVVNSGSETLTTYDADGTPSTPTIRLGRTPGGVAVDATGKIYVTHFLDNTVTTYNADGTAAKPTITTGLNQPDSVAVDAAGEIFVANYGNSTVTTYNTDGTETSPTISAGLNIATGVAVDASGKIYVTSAGGQNTVTTYNADGTASTPTITSGLDGPIGVAVDAAGKIYVANVSNSVKTYNADGTASTPTIITGLNRPSGVAVH